MNIKTIKSLRPFTINTCCQIDTNNYDEFIENEIIYDDESERTNEAKKREYCFYDDHDINEYSNKRVIYIASIGTIEGRNYYKYGKSTRITGREIEHLNRFDKFILKHVEICDNETELEKQLSQTLQRWKIKDYKIIRGNKQRELFYETDEYKYLDVIEELKKLNQRNISTNNNQNNNELEKLKYELELKREDRIMYILKLIESGKVSEHMAIKLLAL